jgi:hypothetical protein
VFNLFQSDMEKTEKTMNLNGFLSCKIKIVFCCKLVVYHLFFGSFIFFPILKNIDFLCSRKILGNNTC